MQRIDLIGSAGVGKSTVYAELRRNRKRRESSWLTSTEAVHLIYKKKNKSTVKSELYNLWRRLGASFFPAVLRERPAFDPLLEDAERWSDFIDFCLSQINRNGRGSAQRLVECSWLSERVTEIALLEQSDLHQQIIWDDSLTLKMFHLLPNMVPDKTVITRYIDLMPQPSVCIHLYAPKEVIQQRLHERRANRITRVHSLLSETEIRRETEKNLEVCATSAIMLRDQGVSVIDIDMTEGLERVVAKIDNFLKLENNSG